ncbi:hypothetical protein ES703_91313 [subsurface metagenome]
MYQDKRKVIRLSKECWDCLDIMKDVSYANVYSFFWAEKAKLVQQAIRKIAPDIKGDWLRFKYEGKTVTFSISDQAIADYKPKIQEFSSFGSAVRMLGAYEDYVQKIVEISYQAIPQEMTAFRNKYKKYIRNMNSFIKSEVGRGIDFFHEVFNYSPHLSYKPSLEFFFQLRNITVHKSGIADQRLCDAANSPYIKITGILKIGDKVNWNLSLTLQLHHLLTSILPEVDPLICRKLRLTEIEKQAYWYLNGENA